MLTSRLLHRRNRGDALERGLRIRADGETGRLGFAPRRGEPMKHMAIPKFFRPVPELNDEERQRGLGNMTRQAISAAGADGLASGGFLASFALILGASNFHIGIMTAIPFIVQPLQLVAVLAIERLRLRKAVAVTAYFFAYATWIPIALLPFLIDVPNPSAVTLMLVFIALRGISNAFVNASWNGWLRDLVPQDLMGKFFAQRLRVATISAAAAGLIAALYIDWWKTSGPSDEIFAYSYAMLFGSVVLGFGAVGFMARMPEPQMIVPTGRTSLGIQQPRGTIPRPELPATDQVPVHVELRRSASGTLLHRLHADQARHEPDVGRGAGRVEPDRQRPLPAGLGGHSSISSAARWCCRSPRLSTSSSSSAGPSPRCPKNTPSQYPCSWPCTC